MYTKTYGPIQIMTKNSSVYENQVIQVIPMRWLLKRRFLEMQSLLDMFLDQYLQYVLDL